MNLEFDLKCTRVPPGPKTFKSIEKDIVSVLALQTL